jgi:hypothetical protein
MADNWEQLRELQLQAVDLRDFFKPPWRRMCYPPQGAKRRHQSLFRPRSGHGVRWPKEGDNSGN